MNNIHASCVAYYNQGVLIYGKSGLGKSDLCLRMIMDKGAKLVADDRVDIYVKNGVLKGRVVDTIAGLLEVRGVGLARFEHQKSVRLKLAVELVRDTSEIERLPNADFFEYEGVKIRKIKLCAFEASAVDKIIIALGL